MAAQGKLGPLAAKALTQVGIPEQQKPPVDLAARLDTPLGDLIKQHRKEPRSLLERARAKAGAKAKAKAKGQAGNAGVNSKVTKKVIAKDAKAAVRSILSSASHNQKPKPNAPRPAPHLVPAGKKLTINRKPAAAAHHKAGAKPAAAPKLTISLKNDRKPNKPAARVQLKNTNPVGGHRAIVVANAAQKRQDQRQQVVQARRVIQPGQAHSPKPAAAAAKGGLTLSERFSQAKPKQQQQQQQHGGGGRKVNVKGGRQQGGASFRVNLN